MTDRVKALITMLAPGAICDSCIADKLALASAEEAAQSARELTGEDGFERRKQTCAICGETGVTTRRNPR